MSTCLPETAAAVPAIAEVAFGFIFASYLAGVAIMSVPAGKEVRRVGRRLIGDSVQAAMVVALLAAPAVVMNFLMQVGVGDLRGEYDALFLWLGFACPSGGQLGLSITPGLVQAVFDNVLSIVGLFIGLALTSLAITAGAAAVNWLIESVLGLTSTILQAGIVAIAGFSAGLIGIYLTYQVLEYVPIFALAPTVILIIFGIYFLAQFIVHFFPVLMALGALLFAAPYGVGRKLGVAVMALSLVLYIGLPFMPVFVNVINTPQTATQALQVVANSNPNTSGLGINNPNRPSDAFFSVTTLGPTYSDYFAIHVQPASGGKEWVIWTGQNGEADYPLPTGEYKVSSVYYLGASVPFSAPEGFVVAANSDPTAAPVKTAVVAIKVQIYAFQLQKVNTPSPTELTPPTLTSDPFFLSPSDMKGGSIPYPPVTLQLDTVNFTVCSSSRLLMGQVFVPNGGILTGTDVEATYANVPATMNPTPLSSLISLPVPSGSAVPANGQMYTFTMKSGGSQPGVSNCRILSLHAKNLAAYNYNYLRNDVDPTGYRTKPPPEFNYALQSQLDRTTALYMELLFIPVMYLLIVLTAIASGLANWILTRWE